MHDDQTIGIAYGRGHLPLRLPAHAQPTVIRKAALPKLRDPAAAIARAFAQPIASPPLADLARGKRSACILICDITRPVPNRLFLRPMIETLAASGIPLDAITVLVATGLHRPERGRRTGRTGGRCLGTCQYPRREPFRARRGGACRSRAAPARAARRSASTGASWMPT